MSTREPDRDRSIEAMLRRSTSGDALASDPSSRCLDAETLAAWIDGDLAAADVSAAEAHVSSCARCQAMLAAIVRTAPSTPALVPWWRRRWAIGALVPLTAGAVAIAIYIATPDVQQRTAPAVATRPAPPSIAVAPQQEQRQLPPSAATFDRPASTAPQPASGLERIAPPRMDERADAALAQRAAELADAKKEKTDGARRNEVAGVSAPTPASPPPAVAPLEETASRFRDAQVAPQAASARAAAAPQREATAAGSEVFAKSAFMRPPTEILSPDQSVRWRPGASGSIYRSIDGGATWTALSSGVTEDLLAGSAPSSTACWIVGRRGTVLLTTDGVQWRRIAFPETVDLIGVQATDLATATVTTVDGRRFRTADGGQSWTRQ